VPDQDRPAAGANPWLAGDVPRGRDYDRRFERLAAAGADVHGEADLVDRLGGTSVLDAGCGTGRVALELARRGWDTVGVDLDPAMLEVAREKGPHLRWEVQDLATLALGRHFDVVLGAGNVLLFVSPGSEPAVVAALAGHLAPGGRLVAGFSLGPGRLDLATYDRLATSCGLALEGRYATWSGEPFTGGDYAVSVHRAPPG